ncbi:MAG: epoxyqueuosine reductase QueH [Desulfovibrio sp.]|nr:epoxyqueuosine reductase QueH [Desulfovibrio sp.]
MRILVHICCGPCGITVLQRLLSQGHELEGLFFNPNIQPLGEYMLRREGVSLAAERLRIPLRFADALPKEEQEWRDPWLPARTEQPDEYADALPPAVDPAPWLRAVAGRESARCLFCCRVRLQKTAELALAWGFDGFTSSLLYSRHQKHDHIRKLGEIVAASVGPRFVYEDFRVFWQEGIRLSKAWRIYRQQYCGCLFSEYERYRRNFLRSPDAG